MFGREAVVYRCHHAAGRVGQGAQWPVMGFQVSCKKPSAMEEDDGWQATAAVGVIYSDRDLAVSGLDTVIFYTVNRLGFAGEGGDRPVLVSCGSYRIVR